MSLTIQKKEAQRLRRASRDSLQWKCYDAMRIRAAHNTREDSWVQPGDTQEWYHLCWERMSDAAFVYYMEQEESLGQWIRNRVLELISMSADEWIGPWYRRRSEIPVGYLETSHITLALCEAYANCQELFTWEELKQIRDVLAEKGMTLCMRFCQNIVAEAGEINNWFLVILDGYGTAAALLGEKERIREVIRFAQIAASVYDCDSYGESMQYSNYATLHLSHLHEILLRLGFARQEELNLKCYTNLIPWYAASYLYNKPLQEGKPAYPRTVNFGDSAVIYRTSGDVLVQVASRMKNVNDRAAGLAAWLFEKQYENPYLGPDELAALGLFCQFSYGSILGLPDCAKARDPYESGLPEAMSFYNGQIIVRDEWENTRTVVALQAGYQPQNATGHRHRDQNSFQLVIGRERMLVDPGHCCYRLKAQQEAVSDYAHNTITIKKDGVPLEQEEVTGNINQRQLAKNHLLWNHSWNHIQLVASDMGELYGGTVERAVRVWVMNLPHQMMTIDLVKTLEPTTLCTHFNVNNRDNKLQEHIYSDHRLVLRRNSQALKLFEMQSMVDGVKTDSTFDFDWSAMHAYYHPLPNQAGQGKEGSLKRYCWEDIPGKEHIRIHTFVMDTSEEIVRWHVLELADGWIRMENPSGDQWIDVKAKMDRITIRNEKQEETMERI